MRLRALWAKLRRKRVMEYRRKRYRTVFVPRPDREFREDIESSFPRPKE